MCPVFTGTSSTSSWMPLWACCSFTWGCVPSASWWSGSSGSPCASANMVICYGQGVRELLEVSAPCPMRPTRQTDPEMAGELPLSPLCGRGGCSGFKLTLLWVWVPALPPRPSPYGREGGRRQETLDAERRLNVPSPGRHQQSHTQDHRASSFRQAACRAHATGQQLGRWGSPHVLRVFSNKAASPASLAAAHLCLSCRQAVPHGWYWRVASSGPRCPLRCSE